MATIDDKVVAMSFESSKFESGVDKTISSLDKLKAALKFPKAGKGLEDLNNSAKRVDFSHISNGITGVRKALDALRLVSIGVMSQLGAQLVRFGGRFAKQFTLQPIIDGYKEYATNLNAVQTILANTQASGATLQDVNAALLDLNKYSDKTIYNFSQMAKNIGTFTAAGVDLKTSTASIKGIANLAALSGSNAEQASTAMYQLSQAISAGQVHLQDWNSVVNAGMGGTVFQRALAQTAEAMGTIKKGAVELKGPMKNVSISGQSFRQSLQGKPGQKSWLTSDVLTTTLKQFTGDLSDAELAAIGFNQSQIKAIQQTAKTAMHAATEVKTLSQVLDVAKETAGSGWAQTWQIIFGNFGEAKKTFTNLSNAINGFINTNSNARNKVLAAWKDLGGRTVMINAIKTAFKNLAEIMVPIKAAFRDIFPATTGRDLYNLTLQFQKFAAMLKPSPQTIESLRKTFRGLFAVLDIGKQLIVGIGTMFRHLFTTVGAGQGKFLKFTGNVGDFLVYIDKTLKKGDRLNKFFAKLGDILAVPMKALGQLGAALGSLFDKFSPGAFSSQVDGMTKALTPFQKIMEVISKAWDKFINSIKGVNIKPAIDAIINMIFNLGNAIGKAASTMNFEPILAVIRTGLLGGMFLMLKKFLGKGSLLEQLSSTGGGFVKNLAGTFDALRGSMVALQQNIKADTLKKIAEAVAMLAGALVALSLVKPERVNKSLSAMTIAFGELLGAMGILTKITGTKGFLQLPVIAASLFLLAGAIDALSIAVVAMSFLSWDGLIKGLTGVGALLVGIVAMSGPLGSSSAGMIRAGAGMTAIGIGLNIIALAVRQFGSMSMTKLAKGMGSVAVALGIMASAMDIINPEKIIAVGAGLVGFGIALNLIATAVKIFSTMNLKEIGKGMVGIGGALAIIAGAMQLMPSNMPLTAAGLLVVSFALGLIAKAVMKMSGMSWTEIARGLVALGGALVILAGAMMLMQESIAGAAALAIAAVGIKLLAGALVALGSQSWGQILKGLVTLAAAIAILGVAAIALQEAIPAMMGLGVALILIGGALALAGAGIFFIGAGLSMIAVAGPTAIGILIAALKQISTALPDMIKNLILGVLQIVDELVKVAPKFVDALVKILGMLLDAIIKLSPKLVLAFDALMAAIIQIIHDNQGKIVDAGIGILLALLVGIRNHIGDVVKTVVDIIVALLNAIAKNLSRIITAGVSLLASLLKGILSGIGKVAQAAISIVTTFINTIATLYAKIALAGLTVLTKFLGAIASNLGRVISAGANIIVKFVEGMGSVGQRVIAAGTNTTIRLINALGQNSVKLANAGALAIVRFLNGIADAINKYEPQIIKAGARIGIAIVTGMIRGLDSLAPNLVKKAEGLAKSAIGGALHALHIKSPSQVFFDIGQYIVMGLSEGMTNNEQAVKSAEAMGNGVITAVKDVLQITSPSKVMIKLGEEVTKGFAVGIRGSYDDIKSAFDDMNQKLTEAAASARETIASEQAKLRKLREADKPDAAAIREAQAVIAQNQALLTKSVNAHAILNQTLGAQKNELMGLAKEYQNVSDKLKAANDALAQARQTRDDAIKGFSDQYSTLPDIVTKDAEGNAVDQLATYEDALKHQADAVAAYQSTLDQLRKLGLDDATYQKLLQEGTADQAFATQLLAGGKTAVQGLNVLDSQLKKNAAILARHAGTNLYQAGVDAAKGLVNGLKSQQGYLANQMEAIARTMVRALKDQLGIKSPSKVFAEIGQASMEGMAQGFSDSSKILTDSIDAAATDALATMQNSMSNISDIVTAEMNQEPVITPILDLTQVRNQTAELASLTATTPITASVSLGQASAISAQQNILQADQAAAAKGDSSVVKFEQNNYSPESLTEVEIYRQTKNQLSAFQSAFVGA